MGKFANFRGLSRTTVVLLVALLVSAPLQAHLVMVNPTPRSSDDNLTTDPCGGEPAGPPQASYTAGSDVEVGFYLRIKHDRSSQAFISYDGFATRTQLATIKTPRAGNYTMTVPLPRKPWGSAVLQVTHGQYVSCADITLSEGDSFSINPGFNDAWYNPGTDGQGFLITVFPEIQQVFVAWFTSDTERPAEGVAAMLGDPGHRWLTAQGPYDGNTANLTIYVAEGVFVHYTAIMAEADPSGDGTLTIEFADCSEGMVSYEITSLGISGDIPIQRIVQDNVPLCEALADP